MPVCRHDDMPWFNALKAKDPELYREALQYASSFQMVHNTDQRAHTDLERNLVILLCRAMHLGPLT